MDLKPSNWNNICYFFCHENEFCWGRGHFSCWYSFLLSLPANCQVQSDSLSCSVLPNPQLPTEQDMSIVNAVYNSPVWILTHFQMQNRERTRNLVLLNSESSGDLFYFYINNVISLWCQEPLKSGDKSRNHRFWFIRRIEKCNSVLQARSAASELSLQHHFQNSHPIQNCHCFRLLFLSLRSTFCPQLHVEAVSSHFICLLLGFWPPFAAPSTDNAPWWPGLSSGKADEAGSCWPMLSLVFMDSAAIYIPGTIPSAVVSTGMMGSSTKTTVTEDVNCRSDAS